MELLNADSNFVTGTKIYTPLFQAKFSFQEQKYNFGFSASSENICRQFPFTVKAGMLSAGGAISKLNNPTISSGTSPFSTGFSDTSSLNASLPGITSFSKPVSTFFQIGYTKKNVPFSGSLSCFYSPEERITVFSEYNSVKLLKNRLVFSNSFTTGIFPYSENSSSSWTINSPYYSEGEHFCSLIQFSIKYLNAISNFSFGIYETPFGEYVNTFRTDIKLPVNHFTFSFTAFYNPNENVITSSDKSIRECVQMKTGFLYKTILPFQKRTFLNGGLNFYFDGESFNNEKPLRINTGFQILSPIISLSFSGSVKLIVDTTNISTPSINAEELFFQFKNNYYIKNFTPFIQLNATISPEQDFVSSNKKITIKTGLNYSKFPKISSYASYSFNHKNQVISSKKITGGITINTNFRSFTCTLKFSADITI